MSFFFLPINRAPIPARTLEIKAPIPRITPVLLSPVWTAPLESPLPELYVSESEPVVPVVPVKPVVPAVPSDVLT